MRFLLPLVQTLLIVLASQPCSAQQQPSSETINFQEMTFQLPGVGWNRDKTTPSGSSTGQINLARSDNPLHRQSLGIWAVRFDESDDDVFQVSDAISSAPQVP